MDKKNDKKTKVKDDGYNIMQPMKRFTMEDFSVFDAEYDLKIPDKINQNIENQDINAIENNLRGIENNKHCGSIKNFDRYLSMYQNSKSDFIVVSYGVTRKIIYNKYSFIFNGTQGEKKPKGTHLISLVKKDIDKLIDGVYNSETNTYEGKLERLPLIPDKKPYLTFIHQKNLDFFGIGQEALAIDINHCYWRTIYLLKYITEETYKKGIEKNEYKDGRLIAVGTLGKILTVKKYKNGEKYEEYVDDREYLRYGGFFWAVISKVYCLLLELWQTLKEDFLMFLTDCVVIDMCKRDLVKEIMEKHGYQTKEYKIDITEISENKVAWVTDKGEKKHIIHNRKLSNNNENQ